MQKELKQNWDVTATVFHDRPPEDFRAATLEEVQSLLTAMQDVLASPVHPQDFCAAMCDGLQSAVDEDRGASSGSDTVLTRTVVSGRGGARVQLRPDRPALIISGTSWTPDEDFGILLAAAKLYDQKVRMSCTLLMVPMPCRECQESMAYAVHVLIQAIYSCVIHNTCHE